MTDREMLELAAKAAGLKEWGWMADTLTHVVNNQFVFWEPLTDDGDALRLAVKCGLSVEPYPYYSSPKHSVIVKQRRRGDQMREANPTEVVEVYGDDASRATRLAIVESAALIGKSME